MTNQQARDKIEELETRMKVLEENVLEAKAVIVNMGAHYNAVLEHIAKRFIALEGVRAPEPRVGNIIVPR